MRLACLRFLRASLAVAVVAAAAPVHAQEEPSLGPVTLPGTGSRSVYSEIVGQEYRLMIAAPRRAETPLPTLFVLDADMGFPLVWSAVRSLQSAMEIPPLLIVGIAYPGGVGEAMMARTRDYTPIDMPAFVEHGRRWWGYDETARGGGADLFLRFIQEELKPWVEREHGADPDDATIFGHSFGGLFAVHAMLSSPDTFRRYIVSSPSLWWGDDFVFEREHEYAMTHADLPARAFFSVGGLEEPEHDSEITARLPAEAQREMAELREALGESVRMVELLEDFTATLRGREYPSLKLSVQVFVGETHASAAARAIMRGLREVFRSEVPD